MRARVAWLVLINALHDVARCAVIVKVELIDLMWLLALHDSHALLDLPTVPALVALIAVPALLAYVALSHCIACCDCLLVTHQLLRTSNNSMQLLTIGRPVPFVGAQSARLRIIVMLMHVVMFTLMSKQGCPSGCATGFADVSG